MNKMKELLEEDGVATVTYEAPPKKIAHTEVLEARKNSGHAVIDTLVRSFRDTEFASTYSPAQIRFVEILCDPEHQPNQEYDFNDRITQARMAVDAPELQLAEVKGLLHYYLSYYLNNNRYQQLLSKQIQLWNLHKLAVDDIGADKDAIEMHKKISDLTDSLTEQIEELQEKIYKSPELISIAKEEIKKTLSPEQRLLRKRKV